MGRHHTSFAQGDASDLATGLQQTGAPHLVLSDGDLATSGLEQLHLRPALHA